jgi:hypothetical protein
MPVKQTPPRIPLPRNWHRHVKSAVLHTISLAHFSLVQARGMAAGHICRRVRLAAKNERLLAECALLREEIRIKTPEWITLPPIAGPAMAPSREWPFSSYAPPGDGR